MIYNAEEGQTGVKGTAQRKEKKAGIQQYTSIPTPYERSRKHLLAL